MSLQVRRSIHTTASPEATFAFLADFRNAESWDPGTVSCELLSGDGGAGSEYRNVSRFLGRTSELTYRTEIWEPSRRVHFAGGNATFRGEDRITISAEAGGSRVDYEAEFTFLGAARLAAPVVALYLPSLAARTMRQLRTTLDGL